MVAVCRGHVPGPTINCARQWPSAPVCRRCAACSRSPSVVVRTSCCAGTWPAWPSTGRTSRRGKESPRRAAHGPIATCPTRFRENSTWSGVLRCLGYAPSGGMHRYITARVRALGLDTGHFTGRAWSAGTPYSQPRRRRALADVLVAGSTYPSGRLRVRLIAARLKDSCCETCGIDEWRGAPIPWNSITSTAIRPTTDCRTFVSCVRTAMLRPIPGAGGKRKKRTRRSSAGEARRPAYSNWQQRPVLGTGQCGFESRRRHDVTSPSRRRPSRSVSPAGRRGGPRRSAGRR